MPKITSTWTTETGTWNKETEEYENRKTVKQQKDLQMRITDGDGGKILHFIGGPTGFESYYVYELLFFLKQHSADNLCICAGTINKYANCTVRIPDVLAFLESESESEN